MSQLNVLPNYPTPLITGGQTTKDWYFYFAGLFNGLPPANVDEVTSGTSPYTYTAPVKGFMLVTGGTVSLIEFSRDGVTFYDTGQISGSFTLNAADQLRITYSGPPTLVWVPT